MNQHNQMLARFMFSDSSISSSSILIERGTVESDFHFPARCHTLERAGDDGTKRKWMENCSQPTTRPRRSARHRAEGRSGRRMKGKLCFKKCTPGAWNVDSINASRDAAMSPSTTGFGPCQPSSNTAVPLQGLGKNRKIRT